VADTPVLPCVWPKITAQFGASAPVHCDDELAVHQTEVSLISL
jgi:hypothetical protein